MKVFFLLTFLAVPLEASYHELSYKILAPPTDLSHRVSSFGYSLGYQDNNNNTYLAVGAPHADKTGRVYRCNIRDILNDTNQLTTCSNIDLNATNLASSTRDFKYEHDFCLGATISSTNDYFLTCAPLWTKDKLYSKCFKYDTQAQVVMGKVHDTDMIETPGVMTVVDDFNDTIVILYTFPENKKFSFEISSLEKSSVQKGSILIYDMNPDDKLRILGIAVAIGRFFSNDKENITYYAVSGNTDDLKGIVKFFEFGRRRNKKALTYLSEVEINISTYNDHILGSMFGACMHAADLNGDNLSELLVGAPAFASGDGFECGALFIFIGGDSETIQSIDRNFLIYSTTDGGRFGSAVVTADIDSDEIPELFISAPYENEDGIVYVLPGIEVKQIIEQKYFRQVEVNHINNVQKLHNEKFKGFGFSLHVLPDIDNNGCTELAVGSPYSQNAALFRCVPSIRATINITMNYETVPENVTEFIVEVCVNIVYPEKVQPISTNLNLQNRIVKEGNITAMKLKYEEEKMEIKLFHKNKTHCMNVSVDVEHDDPGRYTFTSEISIDKDITKIKEFDTSWAELSPYSIKKKELQITRGCNGTLECAPKLNMTLYWTIRGGVYQLGSSSVESVIIEVSNDGTSVYNACVNVSTSGARLVRPSTYFLKPVRRGHKYNISIEFDLTRATNEVRDINVTAVLYKKCNEAPEIEKSLSVPVYINASNIFIKGTSQNVYVKDTDIRNSTVKSFTVNHYYAISNNDTFPWRKLQAEFSIEKTHYLNEFKIHANFEKNCKTHDSNTTNTTMLSITCTFDLEPSKTTKPCVSMVVLKDEAMKEMKNNSVSITSNLKLRVLPDQEVNQLLTNKIIFSKEKFYNNKTRMIIIFALLGLLLFFLIVFALYKMTSCQQMKSSVGSLRDDKATFGWYGFFKRKGKAKLIALRTEVRRQSVIRHPSSSRPSVAIDKHERMGDDLSLPDNVFEDETQSHNKKTL